MARGWESKSVEDQVQQSEEKAPVKQRSPLTPAQIDTRRRREVLILSRTRVEKDLQSATVPRYRDQLNRALSDIDSQLAALEE
jgi:hypothetical protein